jgi:hypothetical protein
MSQNTVIEYPTGLSAIPFASFLEIEKFSYESAQKYAAQNFNDALGSLGRSQIANKINAAIDGLATVYGSGDTSTEKGKIDVNQTLYSSAKKSRQTQKKIDINTADDSVRVKLKDGTTTTIGQLKQKKKALIDKQDKGLMGTKCMLPLPNEFQYKYGADWNNEFKLGTLALAADEAFRYAGIAGAGGVVGGLIQNQISKLTGATDVSKKQADKSSKLVQSVVGGMKKAADPFKIGSELSPKNVAGLAGLAPNENSIQFFERMQGREFGFRFELASRNKTESNRVIEIIEWFKRGMHPGSKNGKGSAVLLTFPDVFVLTPKFVQCDEAGNATGDPIQHPMMPRTKLCALTGLTINTTPFGQMQTVFDGTIPIVTMELQFKETTKLTRVDMEGSSFAKKDNPVQLNSGVFSRDTGLDNRPEVSF